MSSTNGSEQGEPRAPRRATTSQDPDVLAADIARTREELAETMDAIADRVSPKRVVGRTRQQVADAVSAARQIVLEQVGATKAGVAASVVTHASGGASSRGPVPPTTLPPVKAVQASGLDLSLPAASRSTPPPSPTTTFPTAPAAPTPLGAGPRPEHLAGGALGLLVLLLLRRRRAKRKAVKTGAVAALVGAGAEMRSDFEKARRKGRRRR